MQELARQIQAQGRGEDSILVHMTPKEVGGLQALALAHGGSLTINPVTGLPEAGFLSKILPTLLGVGLSFISGGALTPLMSAALVGGGTGIATGSLEKGLMAGLGAFGGASLGTALGAGTGQGVLGGIGDKVSNVLGEGANAATQGVTPEALAGAAYQAPEALSPYAMGSAQIASDIALPGELLPGELAASGTGAVNTSILPESPSFLQSFGEATSRSMFGPQPTVAEATTSALGREAGLSGLGLRGYAGLGGLALPFLQQDQTVEALEEDDYNPMAEYRPLPQRKFLAFDSSDPEADRRRRLGFERLSIVPTNWPYPASSTAYAAGGAVSRTEAPLNLRDGSFVLDARTVSEVGNGSSSAGQERLAGLGGAPVMGGGDGVSDSIPATIDGEQAARVARDEVIFGPQAVARIGGGDRRRGADRLYDLMDKAHRERRAVKRGEPNKGLGALIK